MYGAKYSGAVCENLVRIRNNTLSGSECVKVCFRIRFRPFDVGRARPMETESGYIYEHNNRTYVRRVNKLRLLQYGVQYRKPHSRFVRAFRE